MFEIFPERNQREYHRRRLEIEVVHRVRVAHTDEHKAVYAVRKRRGRAERDERIHVGIETEQIAISAEIDLIADSHHGHAQADLHDCKHDRTAVRRYRVRIGHADHRQHRPKQQCEPQDDADDREHKVAVDLDRRPLFLGKLGGISRLLDGLRKCGDIHLGLVVLDDRLAAGKVDVRPAHPVEFEQRALTARAAHDAAHALDVENYALHVIPIKIVDFVCLYDITRLRLCQGFAPGDDYIHSSFVHFHRRFDARRRGGVRSPLFRPPGTKKPPCRHGGLSENVNLCSAPRTPRPLRDRQSL